VFTVVVFAGQ